MTSTTVRLACVVCAAAVVFGCGDATNPTSPTSATPARLIVSVTPNPLAAPPLGTHMTWNTQMTASGSGPVIVQRSEARLVDAAGTEVAKVDEFWSRSGGCTACSGDVRIALGGSATFGGQRILYGSGGRPVRFVYTVFFTDDLGDGSTRVDVPVQ